MDISTLLVGGALTGIVVGSWNKIKEWLLFFVSFGFETVDINEGWVAQTLLDHLVLTHKRSAYYRRSFSQLMAYHAVTSRPQNIFTEVVGKTNILFWNGWVPIVFGKAAKSKSSRGNENSNSAPGGSSNEGEVTCQVQFIRGTVDIVKLLEAAKITYEKQEASRYSRFFIKRFRGNAEEIKTEQQATAAVDWKLQPYGVITHGDWVKSPHFAFCGDYSAKDYSAHQPPMRDNLKHLYYPQEVVDLVEEMRYWLETREWHREKRIPWRRGWLLYGKPGTGKTALARAFSQDVDLPLFVYELSGMDNVTFIRAWESMRCHTPCTVLFEDFDNVFHGRDNVAAKASNPFGMMMGPRRKPKHQQYEAHESTPGQWSSSGGEISQKKSMDDEDDHFSFGRFLTFDTVLNAIDGIERCDGIFLIITTNHLEKIDEALGKPSQVTGIETTMSTRPGRIDRVIELKEMLPVHKKEMASWILSEFPEVLKGVHEWIDLYPNVPETPAQFQERCSRLALQEKFKKQEANNAATRLQDVGATKSTCVLPSCI